MMLCKIFIASESNGWKQMRTLSNQVSGLLKTISTGGVLGSLAYRSTISHQFRSSSVQPDVLGEERGGGVHGSCKLCR